MITKARICINMIATKIAERNWFIGDSPTEVDCTVYAYLAILQHNSLQNNALRAHINECPNLVKYTHHIRSKYLTGIETINPRKSIFESVSSWFLDKEDGSLSSTTLKVCAGVVAVGAMVLFAITHNMLEVYE